MLLNEKRTGLWEPELLLVGRGSKISCKNMIINVLHLFDVVILDFYVIFCLSMLKCTYD